MAQTYALEKKLLDQFERPLAVVRSSHPVRIAGRYDAAQTSSSNARYWAWADSLSADLANSKSVRAVLRKRSRYEYENNGYSKGIVNTLSNYVIGNGPQLNIDTENEDFNDWYESEWANWLKASRLAAKLRTLYKDKCRDGEACASIITDGKIKSDVKLNVIPLACERLTDDSSYNDAYNVDGVILDATMEPVAYRVLSENPGNLSAASSKTVSTSAEYFIHWFRTDRSEQHRGIPEFTSTLELFAQLRRYTGATLDAAENAARLASVLKTNAPANASEGQDPVSGDDGDGGAAVPMDTFKLERDMTTVLPDGYDLAQLKPEQPTTTYSSFKAEIIGEIGRSASVPYNIAAGNSSSYNYASGRLDHQSFYKALDTEHDDAECMVLEKILEQFHRELALLEGAAQYTAQGLMRKVPKHTFLWAGLLHVDPSKEANAFETNKRNGAANLSSWYGAQGKDWRKERRQFARELAYEKRLEAEFKISLATAPQAAAQPSKDTPKIDENGDAQNADA